MGRGFSHDKPSDSVMGLQPLKFLFHFPAEMSPVPPGRLAGGLPLCIQFVTLLFNHHAERCPSGLRSTLGKRVLGKLNRGFESHPLRQLHKCPKPSYY